MAMACWEVGSVLLLWIGFETCQVRRCVVLVHSTHTPKRKHLRATAYAYSVFRVAVPTAYLQHFLKSIPEYTERSALPQEEVFSFRLLPARNVCITVNLSLPWK